MNLTQEQHEKLVQFLINVANTESYGIIEGLESERHAAIIRNQALYWTHFFDGDTRKVDSYPHRFDYPAHSTETYEKEQLDPEFALKETEYYRQDFGRHEWYIQQYKKEKS